MPSRFYYNICCKFNGCIDNAKMASSSACKQVKWFEFHFSDNVLIYLFLLFSFETVNGILVWFWYLKVGIFVKFFVHKRSAGLLLFPLTYQSIPQLRDTHQRRNNCFFFQTTLYKKFPINKMQKISGKWQCTYLFLKIHHTSEI